MMRSPQTNGGRRLLRDEGGYALLIVTGALSVVTLLALSAVVLSQQAVVDMRRSIEAQTTV
jgi:hypothetical protein